MEPLADLEERLGYHFSDPTLLEQALTHRSHAHEGGHACHYERLEFLGDAVVGCLVATWLYKISKELSEGELSRRKSQIVSARSLARQARRLGLGAHLRLGVGEERSGGRTRNSLLADAYESVLGAVYLDGGLAAVERVMQPLFEELLQESWQENDAKSRLQEWTQARGGEVPQYELVETLGPDHQPTFRILVRVGSSCYGPVEGGSKKEAEQRAAALALAAVGAERETVSVCRASVDAEDETASSSP